MAGRGGVNAFQAGSPAAWTPPENAPTLMPEAQPLPKIHQIVIRQDLAALTVRAAAAHLARAHARAPRGEG